MLADEKRSDAGKRLNNTDPTRPIGDWKEAWEKAKDRAGEVLRGGNDKRTKSDPLKCNSTTCATLRSLACSKGVRYPVIASIMGWSSATAIRVIELIKSSKIVNYGRPFVCLPLTKDPQRSGIFKWALCLRRQ
jgi:hypothetical protein